MGSYQNIVPLATYLNTATTGAPATTAVSMLRSLNPIAYDHGDGMTIYGINPSDLQTDISTQAKFTPVAAFDSLGTTVIGANTGPIATLLAQSIKDNDSRVQTLIDAQPIRISGVTLTAGTATVDLTSYGFANTPTVFASIQDTASDSANAYVAQVVSCSATSVTVKAWETQAVPSGGGSAVTSASPKVNLLLFKN